MSFSLSNNESERTESPSESPVSSNPLRELLGWMKWFAFAVALVVLMHQFVFHLSTVKGESMQPTLEEGEWLFINKTMRYAGTPPKRGDVVVIQEPPGSESMHPFLVKRVVAVAGDEVHIRGGKLYVNGNEAQEAYTDSNIEDGRFEPYTVAEGHLFVMGDNRHRYASYDSRTFGAIPVTRVVGRAEWIVWPPQKWRSL
ncbi:signal peptidase I [Paenibacillus elgii]|uniref:signal peptidase I n=1 Tax=Paenibacillus elgii TaxID=189691 RepID=UPI001CB91D44|nr:signal peptidase I [Paenibacillus elgii]